MLRWPSWLGRQTHRVVELILAFTLWGIWRSGIVTLPQHFSGIFRSRNEDFLRPILLLEDSSAGFCPGFFPGVPCYCPSAREKAQKADLYNLEMAGVIIAVAVIAQSGVIDITASLL